MSPPSPLEQAGVEGALQAGARRRFTSVANSDATCVQPFGRCNPLPVKGACCVQALSCAASIARIVLLCLKSYCAYCPPDCKVFRAGIVCSGGGFSRRSNAGVGLSRAKRRGVRARIVAMGASVLARRACAPAFASKKKETDAGVRPRRAKSDRRRIGSGINRCSLPGASRATTPTLSWLR